MSIYDYITKLEKIDNSIQHNIVFSRNSIVGEFITHNDKRIKLFYSEYNTYKLKDLSKNYKSFKVRYQFWDPEFCTSNNLYDYDIKFLKGYLTNNLNIDEKILVSGFLKGFLKLYQCIKHSYEHPKYFIEYIKDIKLDKHTIYYLMTKLSLNIKYMIYTDNMINLISRCINDNNLLVFLKSSDFNMSSVNFKRLITGTRLVDDISGLLTNINKTSLEQILTHIDLLKACEEVISPVVVLDNKKSSLFYNILNIDVDFNFYETLYTDLLNLYREKGGDFDIKIMKKNNTIKTNLEFIKEYYKSSFS